MSATTLLANQQWEKEITERHYKREQVRGISLEKEGLLSQI